MRRAAGKPTLRAYAACGTQYHGGGVVFVRLGYGGLDGGRPLFTLAVLLLLPLPRQCLRPLLRLHLRFRNLLVVSAKGVPELREREPLVLVAVREGNKLLGAGFVLVSRGGVVWSQWQNCCRKHPRMHAC